MQVSHPQDRKDRRHIQLLASSITSVFHLAALLHNTPCGLSCLAWGSSGSPPHPSWTRDGSSSLEESRTMQAASQLASLLAIARAGPSPLLPRSPALISS